MTFGGVCSSFVVSSAICVVVSLRADGVQAPLQAGSHCSAIRLLRITGARRSSLRRSSCERSIKQPRALEMITHSPCFARFCSHCCLGLVSYNTLASVIIVRRNVPCAPLSDPCLGVEARRITIVELPRVMTVEEFEELFPSPGVSAEAVRLINQVSPGETLPAGLLMKRLTGGVR